MSLQQVIPPQEHLGGREARAVQHEIGRDERALVRPDVLLEPDVERKVVGDAAHQAHRGVRVRVDEPRQQDVVGEGHVLARGPRRDRPSAMARSATMRPASTSTRMIAQNALRLDRHDPAGIYAEICILHRGCAFAHGEL